MSRLLEKTDPDATPGDRPAVDLRFCTICQQQFPDSEVFWVDGHWSCSACRSKSLAANPAGPPPGLLDDEPDPDEPIRQIQQVDDTLRYCGVAGRYGSYGLLALLAMKYDPISDMMHGVIMADLATWLGTAWFDFKIHRWPVIIELLGFVGLTNVLLYTDLIEQPSDPASFGFAFLAFTLFFTVKGSIALLGRMHGHHEE